MGLQGLVGWVVGAPTRQKSPILSLRPGWVGPAQQGGQKAHHQLQELSSTQTTPTGQGSQDHHWRGKGKLMGQVNTSCSQGGTNHFWVL